MSATGYRRYPCLADGLTLSVRIKRTSMPPNRRKRTDAVVVAFEMDHLL